MVAMLILMVGMLALLSAASLAIDRNLENLLRNEAVQVADNRMRAVKNNPNGSYAAPFGNYSLVSHNTSKLSGKSLLYTTTLSSSPASASSNQLSVKVVWTVKGKPLQHELVTLKTY
jgi:Tfp pilus assembly protein PilV